MENILTVILTGLILLGAVLLALGISVLVGIGATLATSPAKVSTWLYWRFIGLLWSVDLRKSFMDYELSYKRQHYPEKPFLEHWRFFYLVPMWLSHEFRQDIYYWRMFGAEPWVRSPKSWWGNFEFYLQDKFIQWWSELVCYFKDHDYEHESYANGDHGGEGATCQRCGHNWWHQYY